MIFPGIHTNGAPAHGSFQHLKAMHAIPYHTASYRRNSQRSVAIGLHGFRDHAAGIGQPLYISQRRGRKHLNIIFLRQIIDRFSIFIMIRQRLIQENGFVALHTFLEILQMVSRIIDLNHNGIAIGNRVVEILRYPDTPGFQLLLSLIQYLPVGKRRLKAHAGNCSQTFHPAFLRAVGSLHPPRKFHRMTRVQSDNSNSDLFVHNNRSFNVFVDFVMIPVNTFLPASFPLNRFLSFMKI